MNSLFRVSSYITSYQQLNENFPLNVAVGLLQPFPPNTYVEHPTCCLLTPLNCVMIQVMLILAVDTTSQTGSVAVLSDGKVLADIAIARDVRSSSGLFNQTASVLAKSRLSFADFELFAVSSGPGSFTGVRVGLTAVKAWAEVYKRPIAAVSGLKAIASQTHGEPRLIAPFFSAGRGQVFGALYSYDDARLEVIAEEMVLSPRDFLSFLTANAPGSEVTLVSPTPLALDDALPESLFATHHVQAVSEVLAGAIGALGYQLALRNELVDACELDANYVRRCDAEHSWTGSNAK